MSIGLLIAAGAMGLTWLATANSRDHSNEHYGAKIIDPPFASTPHYAWKRGTKRCWEYYDYLKLYHPEIPVDHEAYFLAQDLPTLAYQSCVRSFAQQVHDDALAMGTPKRELMSEFRARRDALGMVSGLGDQDQVAMVLRDMTKRQERLT